MHNFNPFKYFTIIGIMLMVAVFITLYYIINSAYSIQLRPYTDVELCHDHEYRKYNTVKEYRHCHEYDINHLFTTGDKHYKKKDVL